MTNKDVNNNITVASLMDALENDDYVDVNFITKLKTYRVMPCTRNLKFIPSEQHNGRFDPQLNKPNIICVYDFQNAGWRAFRKNSVVSFKGH